VLQDHNILLVAMVGISSYTYISIYIYIYQFFYVRNLFINIFRSNFSKWLIFLEVTVSAFHCYLIPDHHSYEFSDATFISWL